METSEIVDLVVRVPVRNARLRLIRRMNLRLYPCSVAPAEVQEKYGPNRPTRSGSSFNNAGDKRRGAESEFPASSADDEPMGPASVPGRLDEQTQPVRSSLLFRQR